MLNIYKRILQGRLIKCSDNFFIQHVPCIKRAETITVNLVCNFHTSSTIKKTISLTENVFAFNILNRNLLLENEFRNKINPVIFTEEDFNDFLNKNWRSSSASDIVNAFLTIKDFCIANDIKLSDTRFDKLVDGLMDHCENLTTQELLNLLNCLCELPACDVFFAHNFHDIWSCLDDICCWKMIEWDIETCMTVANIWYKLNIAKLIDFIYEMLDRIVKKADFLTKDQLAQIFFCFNVCRNRSVDFAYEYALENQIKNMTIDEMAIVAMGYFKTKTKIKTLGIIENMVDKVIQNSKDIHEISLAAILKIIRFSKPFLLVPKINQMLDKLVDEIPRLSELCCLHIALVSTGLQTYHAETIKRICRKLIVNIHDPTIIRLKDIERILNVLTMYDFDPKTEPDIFSACLKEIHSTERLQEEIKHPTALICAIHFLSLRNLYSYDLMDRVLAPDYIKHNFGKTPKTLPLDVFSLDCSIDIECPGYSGNRLAPNLKYKAAKWLTEFTPSQDQYKKITATDKLFLDTIDVVEKIVGGKQYMYTQHVLPHFPKADIIICKNIETDKFVEPLGFQNYVFGDVMFPPFYKNLKWFAVVIVGWNNTIRETGFPLGHMLMKKRQLEKTGYQPVLVIWNEFLNLSPAGRELYLLNKLNN